MLSSSASPAQQCRCLGCSDVGKPQPQDGIGQKLFEFSSHEEHVMTIRFLKDAPFKGSHGVYFAIKLAVLVLAVLLALHFFGVV
jgi:hypothetical protein